MDLKSWKKALGIGLVSVAAISSPAANAAQVTVTIDVDLPTILVMYHYSTITLALDQAALGSYVVGTTAVACGADFCDDQGSPAAITVSTITANESVTQAVVDPGLGATTTEFRVVDSVGVRALGCGVYDVIVADLSTDAGVSVNIGSSLSTIDGAGCSFALTTGDLVFDVDYDQVAGDPVSAVFDVTITGF